MHELIHAGQCAVFPGLEGRFEVSPLVAHSSALSRASFRASGGDRWVQRGAEVGKVVEVVVSDLVVHERREIRTGGRVPALRVAGLRHVAIELRAEQAVAVVEVSEVGLPVLSCPCSVADGGAHEIRLEAPVANLVHEHRNVDPGICECQVVVCCLLGPVGEK